MSFKFKESCGGGTFGINAGGAGGITDASGWNSIERHIWHDG